MANRARRWQTVASTLIGSPRANAAADLLCDPPRPLPSTQQAMILAEPIGPLASRNSSAATCFRSTSRTAWERRSVKSRGAVRNTIRFLVSISRESSGGDETLGSGGGRGVRSVSFDSRRLRWRRHVAESIAGTCTCTDSNAHANAHANTYAERRHNRHHYFGRRFTQNADGSSRDTCDVREQRYTGARDGF